MEHYLIDNASLELIKEPSKFDLIITTNMFGDIIADELSQISGCPGILASAEINDGGKGIFTPNQLHNSNEEIIGKDMANPIGLILSTALMLRYSFNRRKEADLIEEAVNKTISQGYTTYDIHSQGKTLLGTSKMGDMIADNLG